MNKNFSFSKLIVQNSEVIDKIEQCIKITLGPTGKNGLIFTERQGLKFLTNGSLLIKSLEFSNHSFNVLLKLLEQAASLVFKRFIRCYFNISQKDSDSKNYSYFV